MRSERDPGRSVSRRTLLLGAGGLVAAAAGTVPWARSATAATRTLAAAPGTAALVGGQYPDTAVWCYGDAVPGPTIRARQGDRVRIDAINGLETPTTIHWHGLRVPNAMDGVPHLTQKPIAPGGRFAYEFELPDAGTYWYHPHASSPEQVGRGLYGAFVIEEPEPLQVDRDLVCLLDDWRLDQQAQITDDFRHFHDLSHNGRLGNTVTLNGRLPQDQEVRAGERLRLRLINAANARIFALSFEGHRPQVVALDGQPVTPHAPEGDRVVLAPSQRVDLVLDCEAAPGSRHKVVDSAYKADTYRFTDLVYSHETPLREHPLEAVIALPANPVARPDLAAATRHRIEFGGGVHDPKLARGEVSAESLRSRFAAGGIWTINGEPRLTHQGEPLVTLARGSHAVFEMTNDSRWDHPIHLHGHSFQVLSLNGRPKSPLPWRDTVLMAPGDRMEIAFVADNPGDWMFHCHILEHQVAGMMATVRVS